MTYTTPGFYSLAIWYVLSDNSAVSDARVLRCLGTNREWQTLSSLLFTTSSKRRW